MFGNMGVNSFGSDRMGQLALHPTTKPVRMLADAIKDVTARNGIVLDVFGGSGSTLIAAHKTGRRARIAELDPVYVDRIVRRWQAYANDDAVLKRPLKPLSRSSGVAKLNDLPIRTAVQHRRAALSAPTEEGHDDLRRRIRKTAKATPVQERRNRESAGPTEASSAMPEWHEERLKAIIRQEAYRLIDVNENGKKIRLPLIQAIIRRLGVFAAQGRTRAMRYFMETLKSLEQASNVEYSTYVETLINYKEEAGREFERRKKLNPSNLIRSHIPMISSSTAARARSSFTVR